MNKNIGGHIFYALLCTQVQLFIENVIKKGRGNRPDEALATLYLLKKVLNSTELRYFKFT
ncbi:hypothetical protein KH5_06850 [Urechidicola sp. KH5]